MVVDACVSDFHNTSEACHESTLTPKFKSKVYEDTNFVYVPQAEGDYNSNPIQITFARWKVSML